MLLENKRKIYRMRKKKVKLNSNQKELLKNLEHYISNEINWVGEQDLRATVVDGHIAIISRRGDPCVGYAKYWTYDFYDTIMATDTLDSAMLILKYSMPTCAIAVDLRYLLLLKEVNNIWKPRFGFSEGFIE